MSSMWESTFTEQKGQLKKGVRGTSTYIVNRGKHPLHLMDSCWGSCIAFGQGFQRALRRFISLQKHSKL